MIIWLASYPKSGNTWLRTIISQILYFDQISKENPLEKISEIKNYPKLLYFKELTKNPENVEEIVKNWSLSQDVINLQKKIKVFKTHNIFCNFGKYSFSSLKNTAGVIQIVRDPRNVVSSLKNHYSIPDDEKAVEFITNENKWILDMNKNIPPTFISSWKLHYNSWKKFPKNHLLIKYEKIVDDPIKIIKKIYKYLQIFFKINLTEENLIEISNNTSFDNLKIAEVKGYFNENVYDHESNTKKNFFDLGPKNDWREKIDRKNIQIIEKEFQSEMKELNYL
tara:strand:+ start:161 stop:1000 length:840 start_codon:yes stop_codon:yes gene_type:complete